MSNRYFAANSLAAFTRTSTAIVENTAITAAYDSAYVSNSISLGTSANDYIETSAFSATGTVWTRVDVYPSSGGGNTTNGPLTYLNGTTGVFRIIVTGGLTFQAQYWNGAWTNTGSTFALTSATRATLALKIVLGSSFEIYKGGTLVASGSGWSGGGTTITSLCCYTLNTNGSGGYYSQIMIADYDISNAQLMTAAINGNSATNTSGTGAYTDVNETVLDDSTAVVLSATSTKKGFTKATLTIPGGFAIIAGVINARGRVSGGTVTVGKLGWLSNGSSTSSSDLAYGTSYGPRAMIQATDPSTGSAFSQSGFNNAEPYIEAA